MVVFFQEIDVGSLIGVELARGNRIAIAIVPTLAVEIGAQVGILEDIAMAGID